MTKQAIGKLDKFTAVTNRDHANQFDWGAIQWLVSGDLMDGANITFGFVEIEPGRKNPRHYHPNSDEVLYLIEGELRHTVGENIYHLTAGTAIFIPQQAPHDAFNPGSKTARMVVAYPTGDRQMVPLEAGEDE
ncbi:MAG TPA: cupin domain-containing protein [Caldilineaceae bacterium]|nr:cupin domain-containing protein [Caldilineaceae bacterium]